VVKSKRIRWAGYVVSIGERRDVYRILMMKPEGKRSLGRPRGRWKFNIKIVLQEIENGGMEWIGLAQDRESWPALVNSIMNFRVP
jgi:hypothetical protein